MSEWISVDDRLPESPGYNLCVYEQNLPYIAAYDKLMGQWHDTDLEEGCPTHWMPLPSPPKE